jgi:hypothetical protein
MKRKIGAVVSFAGFAGIIYYGYQYIQDSESFEVLGTDVAISSGDYVPILISVVVLLLGFFLMKTK